MARTSSPAERGLSVVRINRLAAMQFIGPAALFAAVGAAEAAALALSRFPSSEWLWAVNLGYFSPFQQAHYTLKGLLGFDYEQFYLVALPLFAAALIGLALKRHLLLGVASNLSFAYIGFVLIAWLHAQPDAPQASLVALYTPSQNPDAQMLVALIVVSVFSFLITHFDFLRRVRAEAR